MAVAGMKMAAQMFGNKNGKHRRLPPATLRRK